MHENATAVLCAPVNVDLLPHVVEGELVGMGVRVRPFGRDYPKDVMLLGYASDLEGALNEVFALAEEERWEALDWRARPWAVRTTATPGRFGPPQTSPQTTPVASSGAKTANRR